MKPMVEGMGLSSEKQREKLNGHPVLAPTIRGVPFPSAGGPQNTLCIPLTRLNFWLATISALIFSRLRLRALAPPRVRVRPFPRDGRRDVSWHGAERARQSFNRNAEN